MSPTVSCTASVSVLTCVCVLSPCGGPPGCHSLFFEARSLADRRRHLWEFRARWIHIWVRRQSSSQGRVYPRINNCCRHISEGPPDPMEVDIVVSDEWPWMGWRLPPVDLGGITCPVTSARLHRWDQKSASICAFLSVPFMFSVFVKEPHTLFISFPFSSISPASVFFPLQHILLQNGCPLYLHPHIMFRWKMKWSL